MQQSVAAAMSQNLNCDIRLNSSLPAEARSRFQDTRVIRSIIAESKVIAVVGISSDTTKPSSMVASYLQDEGYKVVPISPRGGTLLGETVYPSLESVPFEIDLVDCFRPSAELPSLFATAIQIGAKAVWSQLKLYDIEAGDAALAAGLKVVMDKCIKMEHGRFGGQLHWAGMNTEVITAQRAKR